MKPHAVLLPIVFSFTFAVPALAQPAPAGKCSLDEGLVAQVTPDASPKSLPHALSMPLPAMGNAVADVAFRIEADGSVQDLKVLCLSAENANLRTALQNLSKKWKFIVPKESGNALDVDYRLSASGALPLSFAPEKLNKIQT